MIENRECKNFESHAMVKARRRQDIEVIIETVVKTCNFKHLYEVKGHATVYVM